MNVTETAYDAMRRPTVVKHHDGGIGANVIAAERTNYNLLGQVTSQEGGTAFAGTSVTTWLTRESRTYTPTGQVATVTNGAGNVATNIYDPVDRVLEVRDPINRRTRFEYDLAGRQLREIRGFGSSEQLDYARYSYTANGLRAWVRDANLNRSTFVYDGFDRLCRLYFPMPALGADQSNFGASGIQPCDGGTLGDFERYQYDANSNRTHLRLRGQPAQYPPSGQEIVYHYDNLNRECFKDLPAQVSDPLSCGSAVVGAGASDVFSAYDLAGRRTSARFASVGGEGIIYVYDTAGRLSTETSYGRTLTSQYWDKINRTHLIHPDANFIRYTYDALNRMRQVRENDATSGPGLLADNLYDPLSRRIRILRAGGIWQPTCFVYDLTTCYAYDNASRPTQLEQNLVGTGSDQTLGFAYSAASQITSRTASNDNYGWTTNPFDIDYQRNGLNEYTAVDGAAFAYDPRGNLIDAGTRKFCYDLENRLTQVRMNSGALDCGSPTAATHRLTYDPLGRLKTFEIVGGATRQFLYDGDRLVAEYDGAGVLQRRYVHGAGVDEPLVAYPDAGLANRQWLIADHQGTIIAETDSGGATSRYRYGSYGEPDVWAGTRFRYTGQIMLPEVQLYHYKARVYDPILGRFLQTDPAGYDTGLNPYTYVGNEPLSRIDPTGMETWVIITYGRPWGAAGAHAALFLQRHYSKPSILYDPAGSFIPPGGKGHHVDLNEIQIRHVLNYISHESQGGRQLVKVLVLETSDAEEEQITEFLMADQGPDMAGGQCACAVSQALASLDRFADMVALTPDGLYDEVRERQTPQERRQNMRIAPRPPRAKSQDQRNAWSSSGLDGSASGGGCPSGGMPGSGSVTCGVGLAGIWH